MKEVEGLKTNYEKNILSLKRDNQNEIKSIKKSFSKNIQKLSNDHESRVDGYEYTIDQLRE